MVSNEKNREQKRAPQTIARDSLCPSVIVSELLSQLDCSNSAFFPAKNSIWLFSCSLNYPSFLQEGTSVGRFLLTVEAFCGEQVPEGGLVTPVGNYQTLTRNSETLLIPA